MMYPSSIHVWFIEHNINPAFGWEMIETATDYPHRSDGAATNLDTVDDLKTVMVEYLVYLLFEYDDGDNEALDRAVNLARKVRDDLSFGQCQMVVESASSARPRERIQRALFQ